MCENSFEVDGMWVMWVYLSEAVFQKKKKLNHMLFAHFAKLH